MRCASEQTTGRFPPTGSTSSVLPRCCVARIRIRRAGARAAGRCHAGSRSGLHWSPPAPRQEATGGAACRSGATGDVPGGPQGPQPSSRYVYLPAVRHHRDSRHTHDRTPGSLGPNLSAVLLQVRPGPWNLHAKRRALTAVSSSLRGRRHAPGFYGQPLSFCGTLRPVRCGRAGHSLAPRVCAAEI